MSNKFIARNKKRKQENKESIKNTLYLVNAARKIGQNDCEICIRNINEYYIFKKMGCNLDPLTPKLRKKLRKGPIKVTISL